MAIVVGSVLGGYFAPIICLIKKERGEEQRMQSLYNEMKENAPELIVKLRELRFGSSLPFFDIWERTGKHITEFPYNFLKIVSNIIHKILSIVKRVVYKIIGRHA